MDGANLDENALDEVVGLADQVPVGSDLVGTIFYCGEAVDLCADSLPGLSQRTTAIADATISIDWNCNGIIDADLVSAEINLEAPRQVLRAFADWPRLDFSAAGTLGAARTSIASTPATCSPGAFPDDYPINTVSSIDAIESKSSATAR